MVPVNLKSPTIWSFAVGFVVPIPTEPIPVVEITVPPAPTFNILAAVKMPVLVS